MSCSLDFILQVFPDGWFFPSSSACCSKAVCVSSTSNQSSAQPTIISCWARAARRAEDGGAQYRTRQVLHRQPACTAPNCAWNGIASAPLKAAFHVLHITNQPKMLGCIFEPLC